MLKASGQLKHKILREDLMRRLLQMKPGDAFLSVREIMEEFDVSQATVSKALEGLCEEGLLIRNVGLGTFVTEEVMRHKKGAPPVICLALPRWESSYYHQVENSFSSIADELGYEADIIQFDWHNKTPQMLPQRKIDALLTIPASLPMEERDIENLRSFGKPLAIFDRQLQGIEVDCVYADERYAGALAANHLLELGHKKLAIIISEPHLNIVAERQEGFNTHCAIHGVKSVCIDCEIKNGESSLPKVYAKVKQTLAEGAFDFTGLFIVSGQPCLAAMKAIAEAGLKIPSEISMISCSGDSLSAYYTPSLTVVNNPLEDMVRGSIRMLLDRIAGKGPANAVKLKYKPELIVGGSCAHAIEGNAK